MIILNQRKFHDEIELDSEGAEDFLRKYQELFYTNTPIECKGYLFLIASITVDNGKISVDGLQTITEAA